MKKWLSPGKILENVVELLLIGGVVYAFRDGTFNVPRPVFIIWFLLLVAYVFAEVYLYIRKRIAYWKEKLKK